MKSFHEDHAEFKRKRTFLERAEAIKEKDGGDVNIIAAQLAFLAKGKRAGPGLLRGDAEADRGADGPAFPPLAP